MSEDVCSVCRAEYPTWDGPGVAIPWPGVLHESDCPTLPQPTRQQREELRRELEAMRRAHARAMYEARNVWIG